ncbi:MAG: PEP-CTERM sorting domain-containing protein [Cyanobacteria bacterium P01_E01_bin.42]
MMKTIRKSAGLIASILLALGFGESAFAAANPIVDSETGLVIGIKDIEIGGKKYDVEFVRSSFNEAFGNEGDLTELENETPTFWDDRTGGQMAAEAIATVLGDTSLGSSIFIPYGGETKQIELNGLDRSLVWAKFSESKMPLTELENDFSATDQIEDAEIRGEEEDEFVRNPFDDVVGEEGDFAELAGQTPRVWGDETDAMTADEAISSPLLALDGMGETFSQISLGLKSVGTDDASITLASFSTPTLLSSHATVPEPTSTVALFAIGTGLLATRKGKKSG